MKIKRTSFLKGVILAVGLIVLALCILWLPQMAAYFARTAPEFGHLKYPVLIGISSTTIPFFFALYQALKLLKYIDLNEPFSSLSIQALKNIKICAICIGVLYIMGLFFLETQNASQPGITLIGLVISFASAVIAVFAAVLQALLKNTIQMKVENNLTI